MIALNKTFNHHRYGLIGSYYTKAQADNKASISRKRGFSARVVKASGHNYLVYESNQKREG